ncbi:hypothetical protein [Microbacterium tumbae]
MRIALHEVGKGHALSPTSLEFRTGTVRYALAETEQRPTVLGLIASGRMRPATGTVTIDGIADAGMLRRRVALVDAPDVSDPHADIALAGVVAEELMFAGRRATPLHARRWLDELGYGELASIPIGDVDPAARVRILCELAVLRKGTEGIVLVSPDRHGGSPDGWWRIAGEFADRGYAVLVIVGGSAAVALERVQELDAVNASGPVEPLALEEPDPASPSSEHPANPSLSGPASSSLTEPITHSLSETADPSYSGPDSSYSEPDSPSLSEPSPRSLSERSESKRRTEEEKGAVSRSVSTRSAPPSSLNEREKETDPPSSLNEREKEEPTRQLSPTEPASPRSLSERSESKRPDDTDDLGRPVSTRSAPPSSLNEREKDEPAPPSSLNEREKGAVPDHRDEEPETDEEATR